MKKFSPQPYTQGLRCVYCQQTHLYRLGGGRVHCAACRSRYTLRRLQTDLDILRLFVLEVPARRASLELGYSYNSIKRRYAFFRSQIARWLARDNQGLLGLLTAAAAQPASAPAACVAVVYTHERIAAFLLPNADPAQLAALATVRNLAACIYAAADPYGYRAFRLHGRHLPADSATPPFPVSPMELFWLFATERFYKYRAVRTDNLAHYLAEFAFRFNARRTNLLSKLIPVVWQQKTSGAMPKVAAS